jgi:hypothetical protein
MRTLRRLRALPPRRARGDAERAPGDDLDGELAPEAVFDRSTGPFGSRRAVVAPGGFDEET